MSADLVEAAYAPGSRLNLPNAVTSVADRRDRLVEAIVMGRFSERRLANGLLEHIEVAPGSVDLALVRQRRCPVLIEHHASLESTIGLVESVCVEDDGLRAILRFAKHGRAQEIWNLIEDGCPVAVSIGMAVTESEPLLDETGKLLGFTILSLKMREVSVCATGADPAAHIIVGTAGHREHLEQRATEMRENAEKQRWEARFTRIRALEWAQWPAVVAPEMATELGVDAARLEETLTRAVDRQIERLCQEKSA